MAQWGIVHDAGQGVLRLAPQLEPDARTTRCGPFRAGRTVVALEVRRRPSSVVLRVEVTFGPPIRVEASLPDTPPDTPILVDDVPIAGPRVAFEARGSHEIHWAGV
jgi:hypothetical protein